MQIDVTIDILRTGFKYIEQNNKRRKTSFITNLTFSLQSHCGWRCWSPRQREPDNLQPRVLLGL